ncbi:MAG: phosphate ABC transporter substrate-binding protein [Candidatus Fermentibacteraceae bacterium]
MRNSLTMRMLGIAMAAGLVFAAGCGESGEPAEEGGETAEGGRETQEEVLSGELNVQGSTTVQPLAERLAEGFEALHGEVRINVGGGGSSVGVKSAGEGSADIGMASRVVKESEFEEYPNISVHVIARDGIAVVAHPDVTVDDMSAEQIRGIFSGEITSWSEVGGQDGEIVVVSREEGSGTRAAFEDMVMGDALIHGQAILQPSNGAVRTTVSTTPSAIAYLSFGYLDDSVQPIKVDGVPPTEENAASGDYSIVRPLNMITDGEPAGVAAEWLEFIMGEEGQAIVAEEGYLPVD